tara:strand:+ start:652 stop:1749 length:1098 start_codon:yes stop_codon:yes gene_type:complete
MFNKISRTIQSILILNLKIIKFKIFEPKKKILIFFHPKKNLTNISIDYIQFLLADIKNTNVVNCIGHVDDKLKEKKFFFISQKFLKYILFVDYFFCTYVTDNFPFRCIKIYMHHDIYDTPVVNNDLQNEFLLRLNKYDYLLLPNEISKKYFRKLYSDNKIKEKFRYFVSGYLKLQYLKKLNKKNQKDKIIIAPTNIYSFNGLTIFPFIKKIIFFLLSTTKYLIVLRPHPSNREDPKFLKLKKLFQNNQRFKYDVTENYHKNYSESVFMITDLSGTAYTYCFLTKKPVIFFNDRNLLEKNFFLNLNYFKDIKKIGFEAKSFNELKIIIQNINKYSFIKKLSIKRLENQRFTKLNSKKIILEFLNNC